MKPRIFINIHYLEIGGAETSLIGLLQALDSKRVDVDLFINDHRGEMMPFIPAGINVLPPIPAYTMIERPMVEVWKKGHWKVLAARLWAKWKFYLYTRKNHPKDGNAIYSYIGKYVTKVLPTPKGLGTYDLAISFLTPHNFVLEKVKAQKKICWIHTDYTRIDIHKEIEHPVWKGFDYIASISKDVTRTFCSVFPDLQGKIIEIENILSPAFVRQRAMSESRPTDMPVETGTITLLTIGRYSYQKKLEEIPILCRLLMERGCNVRWYIMGYGGSDEYIHKAIQAEKMEGRVILLGKRANPYPYIQACDWYVQPSRYEGKSVTVREAQMLYKPVIVTAYPTASSQIQHGKDGIIVPMEVEACAEAMAVAICDKELAHSISEYLSAHDYGNENEVEKIYNLLPA